ncbi:hypothetical protein J6590_056830 [Homalodisca vitripennis]|nr:hypothetical protein J6590_056830 [Homalodisca vitripennis]
MNNSTKRRLHTSSKRNHTYAYRTVPTHAGGSLNRLNEALKVTFRDTRLRKNCSKFASSRIKSKYIQCLPTQLWRTENGALQVQVFNKIDNKNHLRRSSSEPISNVHRLVGKFPGILGLGQDDVLVPPILHELKFQCTGCPLSFFKRSLYRKPKLPIEIAQNFRPSPIRTETPCSAQYYNIQN